MKRDRSKSLELAAAIGFCILFTGAGSASAGPLTGAMGSATVAAPDQSLIQTVAYQPSHKYQHRSNTHYRGPHNSYGHGPYTHHQGGYHGTYNRYGHAPNTRYHGGYHGGYHGPHYNYRYGRYRYYHGGYWYATPWWTVPGLVGSGYYGGASASCSYWHDRCLANWGYGANYRGCVRYHGCY